MGGEDGAIERRDGTIRKHFELMHPERRCWRRRPLPANARRVEQVHIPDVRCHLERATEQRQLEPLVVPEVRNAPESLAVAVAGPTWPSVAWRFGTQTA